MGHGEQDALCDPKGSLTLTCSQVFLQLLRAEAVLSTDWTMDPLSELQDDLTLDDTSQSLNQLKLASIDEQNWPSDEMPDFSKSGGQCAISGRGDPGKQDGKR